MNEVMTVGYEGRTVDELIEVLTQAGVRVLVDVRLTPLSRKPGMSKCRLADALRNVDIDYVHLPGLGNPRDNRDALRHGEPEGRQRYRAVLQSPRGSRALGLLAALVPQRIAVMCFERTAAECHRSMVAEALVEMSPDLRVRDL